MKTASVIARYLLALVFLVFGLNKFFFFIPTGPMPTGPAGQFVGALFSTHYLWAIATVEVVCGLLFLIGRYVPLALVLIGPVIVNIVLYHSLMMPSGVPLALLLVVLWVLTALPRRQLFFAFLEPKG